MSCYNLIPNSDPVLGQQFADLKFGVFYHYGVETYNGDSGFAAPELAIPETQWPAINFNPTGILDFKQWLLPAKMAGAEYAIFTVKHHFGWCAWPTASTTYSISSATAPHDTRDLVREFVDACTLYEIRPILYFSVADRHYNPDGSADGGTVPNDKYRVGSAAAQVYVKSQLTELLSDYGTIYGIWFDVPGYGGPTAEEGFYQHIKSLQPNCVVIANFNNTFISSTGCDRAGAGYADILDGRADVFSGEKVLPASTYTMPFHSIWQLNDAAARWYIFADGDVPNKTAAEIKAQIDVTESVNASYAINMSPGPNGSVSDAQCATMRDLAIELGVINDKRGIDNNE